MMIDRKEEDIQKLMKKYSCSKENLMSLSDGAYDIVLNCIPDHPIPLTEKEKQWAKEIAHKFCKNSLD